MHVFSSKKENVLQKVDFFKTLPVPLEDLPFLIPQKNKNVLPSNFTLFKKSFKVNETFYPRTFLKVKPTQNVLENQYIDVFVFDKKKNNRFCFLFYFFYVFV